MAHPEPRAPDHEFRSDPEFFIREIGLSARELRSLRFLEGYPWVAPLTVAFVWLVFLGGLWFQLGVILEHGADFGLSTASDVWELSASWSESKRPLHPYEVFVIEEVNDAFWKAGLFLVLTAYVAASSFQNRLVLKLWRALRARRSG